MKLMKRKDPGLQSTTRELKTVERNIRGNTKKFISAKDQVDPLAYLDPREKKKWIRLSPRRKRYFLKHGAASFKSYQTERKLMENGLKMQYARPRDRRGRFVFLSRKEAELGHQNAPVPESGTGKPGPASVGADGKVQGVNKIRPVPEAGKKPAQVGSGMSGAAKGGQMAKKSAQAAAKAADLTPSVTKEVVKASVKAAKKTAEFFQSNLQRDAITREQMLEAAKKAQERAKETDYAAEMIGRSGKVIWPLLVLKSIKDFISYASKILSLFSACIGVIGAPGLLFLYIIFLVLAGNTGTTSLTSAYDPACYLSAKYESHGDCGSIGSGGIGEYGFDKSYSLVSFVSYCYNKDAVTYACFGPYLEMSGTSMYNSSEFRAVWRKLAQENKVTFEADQTTYTYQNYFLPAATLYTSRYGYDFVNAPDAVKACVTSFSIRDGAQSAAAYFSGVTADSTPEEIIRTAYGRMQARRPASSVSGPRWIDEEQDCLDLLHGSLDIYEPDTSPSGYGGIDWSWKRGTGGGGNGDIVQLALSKVGCRYSQADRDAAGAYDCSSLVYRLYAEIGITYLSGMSAAGEAQYLESHGMGVSEADLQPGDLIFYSYTQNGRYKNISHVAIYIGEGKQVHAANSKRGVVCDPYRPSNIGVYARPR